MNKIITFLLALTLAGGIFVQSGNAQVTVTGSTGADATYATLKLAFDAINTNTNQNGNNIVITITASTTETATAQLNVPTNYWTSLKIYPTVSGCIISGNLAFPLIALNGADKVTIDGRVNQAGNADLTITNTSTSTAADNTCTIQYTNDAQNNTIQYCYIKGSSKSTTTKGAIIWFSAAANTGNLIDNNYITCAADANRPLNAIYSVGNNATYMNSNITVSNNKFYDFLNKGAASNGINLANYNSLWTISGNSFYETASFVPTTAAAAYNIINVAPSTGTTFTIQGNYIGGSAASCGGTAWTKTNAQDNTFKAIYLSTPTGVTASSIQGNYIQNFDYSNSGTAATNWTAIEIAGTGDVNVGTATGNTIGASTGNDNIKFNEANSNSEFLGIHISGTGTVDCENNIFGSITTTSPVLTAGTSICLIAKGTVSGLYFSDLAGTTIINNNILGSLTTAQSIRANTAITVGTQNIVGIYSTGNGTVTIAGNTVANMYNNTTTTSYNQGIYCATAAAGNTSIYNNFIRNLGSNAGQVWGIGTASTAAASKTVYNNIISLGTGDVNEYQVFGIFDQNTFAAANHYYYYNTVYIAGSPATGTKISAALWVDQCTGNRTFKNNILQNVRSNTGSATGNHYGVYFQNGGGANIVSNLTLGYNDYSVTGTGGILGYVVKIGRAHV